MLLQLSINQGRWNNKFRTKPTSVTINNCSECYKVVQSISSKLIAQTKGATNILLTKFPTLALCTKIDKILIERSNPPYLNVRKRKHCLINDYVNDYADYDRPNHGRQPAYPKLFYRRKKDNDLNLKSLSMTSNTLTNLIVNYIYDKDLSSFRFSWIRQEPSLIACAEHVIRQQYHEEPNDDLITTLMKKSLLELVEENFLIFSDNLHLAYKVRYEYIDFS